MISERIARTQ